MSEREIIDAFIDWCDSKGIYLIEPESDGSSWHHNSGDLLNEYLKGKGS